MLRIGLVRLLAILALGVALPYALYKLSRVVGAPLTVLAAVALGLAYAAIKADHPWAGDGLGDNLRLMAICAAIAGGYAAVAVGAATAIARRL